MDARFEPYKVASRPLAAALSSLMPHAVVEAPRRGASYVFPVCGSRKALNNPVTKCVIHVLICAVTKRRTG